MQLNLPSPPPAPPCPTDHDRYLQVLSKLFGRLNYERTPDAARTLSDFSLTQMRELLADLGNPQLRVPTVHVAGSKGKGSTATMIARIAEAAGCRVGLFTSPHANRFEERFTINGECPTERQVADLFDQLRPFEDSQQTQSGRLSPTFFELATALGWLHFAEEQVDLAVMEVGLGGRLDSTNVCQPLVTVITSISRDHTRLLGNTLASIAREKAGIIKPEIPIFTAVSAPEPANVIAEVAATQQAPLLRLGMEFTHTPQPAAGSAEIGPACFPFDFHGLGVDWKNLPTSMPGEHQTRNAALAVAVSLELRKQGFHIDESAVRRGLSRARCSLRVEVLHRKPLWIVDAAHNPASIQALCETLAPLELDHRRIIFASSRDKEAETLLEILNQSMDEIWLTRFTNNPRAIEPDELAGIAKKVLTKPWRLFENPRAAIEAAHQAARPNDLICCTGSFFLAAEAKAILTDGSILSPAAVEKPVREWHS